MIVMGMDMIIPWINIPSKVTNFASLPGAASIEFKNSALSPPNNYPQLGYETGSVKQAVIPIPSSIYLLLLLSEFHNRFDPTKLSHILDCLNHPMDRNRRCDNPCDICLSVRQ
jgi:hypothetical protein